MDNWEKGGDIGTKNEKPEETLKRISYDTITEGIYAPEPKIAASYNLTSPPEEKLTTRHQYDEAIFQTMDRGTKGFTMRGRRTYGGSYLKDDTIADLEQLLSTYYKNPAVITRIQNMNITRKDVKEIHFSIQNRLSKVWVFKSDPKKTALELYMYHVAYEQGIPTGKPIGYDPEKPYDYDIAIIGGIVEHAGDSYNKLVENLQRKPELVFNTARSVSSMIFDYQTKLTENIEKLRKGGLEIKGFDASMKLDETLLKSEIVGNDDAITLKNSLNQLHSKQKSEKVLNHGDTHTGNIITINEFNALTTQLSPYHDRFGIIDWESLCLDTRYSDLVDFWIHHERHMRNVDKKYPYRLNHFITESGSIDMKIQAALWHVFEMYDPVRKDEKDIKAKFSYHRAKALDFLELLRNKGITPAGEAYKVINSLEI